MWAKLFSKTKEILICTKKGNISSVAAFQSQPRNFFIFYFHRPFKVNLIGGSLLLQWLYTSFLDDSRFFISLINKSCEAEYYVTNKRKSQKPKPGLHLHVLGPSSQVPPSELQFEQAPTYFVHFPLGPQPGTHSHSYGLLEQCPFSQGTPHPLMVSQWLPSIHKRQITKSNQKSKKRGGWKRKKKRI